MVICTMALVAMAELMAITLRMQQLGRNQTAASASRRTRSTS